MLLSIFSLVVDDYKRLGFFCESESIKKINKQEKKIRQETKKA